MKKRYIILAVYLVLIMMPIYWMLNMSLRTNADIMARLVFIPTEITFDNYITIFTDSAWYSGYINSIIYVVLNTIICLV
ncbi:MAG: carbohydrate ABC transporter permease, partial [Desulfotignum sp.]